MARNAGIAAAAIVYVIASCWIVAALGRAHRDGLKEASLLTDRPRADAPVEPVKNTPPAIEIARAPEPPRPPAEPERPAATIAAAPSEPTAVAASPSEPRPTSASPSPAAASKPAEPVADAAAPVGLESINPFFASPEAKRKWDLDQLTPDQEVDLGRELNHMVMLPQLNRRFQNEDMERRLLDAAEPILKNCERQDVRYRFSILDSDAVNAFSHPGGYVYVTRGLMNWISEDQDYVLRFVLAHEIHHVDRGDAIRCLRAPVFNTLPYGTAQLFLIFIFPRTYGDTLEFEADDWALQQLKQLRYSRRECLAFLTNLDRYAGANGFLQGDVQPRDEPGTPLFELHYRALPSAKRRLQRLKDKTAQPVGKAG